MNDEWRQNLIVDPGRIAELVRSFRRVAVLGIRPERYAERAAYYVPAYLASVGFTILPVAVQDPGQPTILGQPVYRTVADVPGPIDVVDVFRKSEDIPAHVPDILKAHPRAVWFQTLIFNDEAAETFARAGIQVVQGRCLMVEQRKLAAASQ